MSIEVNGVTLPDIPSEVLEQYPYVTIYRLWDSANDPEPTYDGFMLLAADSPILYDEETDYLFVYEEGGSVSVGYNLDSATWYTDDVIENEEGLGFEVGTAWDTIGGSLFSTELKWANHDIYVIDQEAWEPSDTIYFARNDSDPNYYAPKSWFDGMARQVMRLTGTSDKLNTDKMLAALKALNGAGGGDTGGGAVTIVPWSTGTDEEIAAMVAAMDAGTLSIEDTGWAIGDERTVTLSAMAATGVGESHAEQTVTLVLMDSQHYTLTEATAGGDTKDHFVVGLKNCLNETGYMNSGMTNYGSWGGSARRTWCNDVFRAAIPETLRGCFKQFKVTTATEYNGTTVTETDDYFALFAEKEVFDGATYSNDTEAAALTQIAWFATEGNRVKTVNGSAGVWWERSPWKDYSAQFAVVSESGSADYFGANKVYGIAPFGCI